MSTRIIVKNLPPYLSQDGFAKHFSDHASPTDSRLQSSKSGKSRRFGFVGFNSEAEATRAVDYWNNTYIGSTKISAELARSVEEEATSNYKRKRPIEDALAKATSDKSSKKRKTNTDAEEAKNTKFQEFLRLNERRSKSKTFLNDDEEFVQQAAIEDDQAQAVSDDDEGYEAVPAPTAPPEHYEVIEHDVVSETAADTLQPVPESARSVPQVADDADDAEWLRTRTSRTLDLTDPAEPLPSMGSGTISHNQERSLPVALTESVNTTADHIESKQKTVSSQPSKSRPLPKTEEMIEAESQAEKEAAQVLAVNTIKDTLRLFLRNLAFSVQETDLQDLFSHYGSVEEIHIPLAKSGTPKGTAYVLFNQSADAIAAFTSLDGKSFHGRLLHILPAQSKITVEKPPTAGTKLNVGAVRKEERRKEAAKTRFNWNSLFLNQNSVLENAAKKFGVEKSELLDPTQSSAAVTMALAESAALNTIKKFFISHGVNLESFSQTKQKDDSILLFKNLPSNTAENELRVLVEGAGGVIRRIVMPEIGGLAIVEVLDANQGKMVFGKLAYRKLGDGIIYLEKGPVNTFSSAAPADQDTVVAAKTPAVTDSDDEEAADTEKATIFVKNLNFETRAPELTKVFESLKGFRQATVKTKPNPKDPKARLSMGFGFVEFATEKDAKLALSSMQGFTLDAHALELKLSSGRSTTTDTNSTHNTMTKPGTKIIVKNLPFETSKSDIQRLFSTYGALKSLRLPKKYNSHLRGFAFLEFVSKREAKNAMNAVSGTHLLGRRLVLEYATSEMTGDEGIDQLIEKTRKKRGAVEAVEGGKRKIGKVNLDGDAEEF